jgi:hypothetical protein
MGWVTRVIRKATGKRALGYLRDIGYLRDKPDPRDLRFSATVTRPSLPPPGSVDLRSGISKILDQGQTNSCVAHAYAYAIDIVETLSGLEYHPISRLYLYHSARAQHGDQKTDGGTYLRSAARALQLVGAPPERFWPFEEKKINKQPHPVAYMEAHPRREGLYERIDGVGDMRLLNIKRALAAGHPVVFGTLITEAFMKNEGSPTIQRPKDNKGLIGGHAMAIVGYDRDGFVIVNSWGPRWRAGGTAWLTHDYMAWAGTSDLWIVRGWRAVKDVMIIPGVH